MDDLMDRKQEEYDRLTVAVAQGYAIANSEQARRHWMASHTEAPDADGKEAAAARQRTALRRLAGYAWRGRNPIQLKPN
jgi:hypothetical protein